ncbi:OB-fold domain-containing protein [Rhodococcus sp. (in: high G+C Gram-positive bacteria)]|uniref:Zn-ribbon domain-containing OB-fold protein n=1 Tax=Rhodococcus sp. TaxID=1831 RepID=UPI00257CC1B8|nr:OB-fold domain-containing protein [Rhodococcus sp. (in: high G+C Gram-positive bacteria)]MBQ9052621.1 OB-fold domain-containing protein [Rhodococcus sp. (in: high G+C Gram-positive bacteria)]
MTNPVPVLPLQRDLASAPFFDGTAQGQLLLRRCTSCEHWNAPDTSSCGRCRSTTLSWTHASGFGTVASWAVIHDRADPGHHTAVAIIELDEGPWIRAQLRSGAELIQTGMPVKTDYEAAAGGESIPVFFLVSGPSPENGKVSP